MQKYSASSFARNTRPQLSLFHVAIVVVVAAWECVGQTPQFFLHDGDSPVVFLGDSITEQSKYTTLIESYVLSRFPNWNVTFRNIGMGGDTAGLLQRGGLIAGLKRDVYPLRPAVVTICFGMNDGRRGASTYPLFLDNSRRLIKSLKTAGARIALLTPSPEEKYELNQPGGSAYNIILGSFVTGLRNLAEKHSVLFVDQFHPFLNAISNGRKATILGADGGTRLIPDGVHPNWGGHLIMATSILKSFQAPALVSRAEIDAATRNVKAEDCEVTLLKTEAPEVLKFQRLDHALPWPIFPDAIFALHLPGFTPLQDLDRYELQVTNLPALRYILTIDDVSVGQFSREALAAGINLALEAGPITQQTQLLLQLIFDKNSLWRTLHVSAATVLSTEPLRQDLTIASLTDLDASVRKQEKAINAARQPLPHVFTLTPSL